jgi:hypothetical protein
LRPTWRRLLAAALVFAAVGAGIWLAVRAATGAAFVAGALSRLLDARVEVGSVSVELGATLDFELIDVRVYRPERQEPVFQVDRARASQSWPQVVAGRFTPNRWQMEHPVLVVEAGGEEQGGGMSRLSQLPAVDLSIRDGVLIWLRPGEEPLRIERLRLDAEQPLLRNRVEGTAAGVARRGDRAIASFSVEFQGWLDAARVQGNVNHLALSALPRGGLPEPGGKLSGRFTAFYEPGKLAGTVDVAVDGFRLLLPDLHGPIVPEEMRLVADVRYADGVLKLRPDPLQLDDLQISGDLSIGTGRGGRVQGWLEMDRFEFGGRPGRLQALRLGGLRFRSWADVDRKTEAGRMEDVRLEIDVPRRELGDAIAFRRRLGADEFRLRASIRDAVFRPRADSSPLEQINGDAVVEGNLLRIENLTMFREGNPLPKIDLSLDGMHRLAHLPQEERRVPAGPGVPIPGLGPAFAPFGSSDPDHPAPRMQLTDFYIGYPGFLLALRDAEVWLSFPENRVRVDLARGIFGGVPAEISGFWDYRANAVHARITYGDEVAKSPSRTPAGWVEGDFRIETFYLGDWRLERTRGHMEAVAAHVAASDIRARLYQGSLSAKGSISLAEPGAAPFELDFMTVGAQAADVGPVIGLQEGTLTGVGSAEGRLAGRLSPEREFLEDAVMKVDVILRDGTLGNTPRTLQLARLVSPLGWTGIFGRRLPYDSITFGLEIDRGRFHTEDFALEGPELRILAAGEIDLLSEDLQTDMLVALLFFQSVDAVVEKVPLVGRWVLGKDRSLVAAYFRLEGAWEDPEGTYMAPQSIRTAAGWAGRVIGGGVKRVRDVLGASPSGNGSQSEDDSSQNQDQ